MAKDFIASNGKRLAEVKLRQPAVLHDPDDVEKSDYVVGIDWEKTFPLDQAKWPEGGGFANQNVVCKLRDPTTLDFLFKPTFPR